MDTRGLDIAQIEDSIKDLEEDPHKEGKVLIKLIDACKDIEPYYKRMCDEMDDNYGDPKGSNYQDSPSIEFYIEADWWHRISKCLRKMFPNEKFEYGE